MDIKEVLCFKIFVGLLYPDDALDGTGTLAPFTSVSGEDIVTNKEQPADFTLHCTISMWLE